MSSELIVPIEPAVLPLVLADTTFLATLADVEGQAAALKVVDTASAQTAANLQVRLTQAGKKLEEERVRITAPFLAAQRKIAEVAKAPLARIELAKNGLKSRLIAYDTEQRRIAAEQERARLAELARLEAIKAKEEAAEAARIAALVAATSIARVAMGDAIDFDDEPVVAPKTETEKAIEAVRYAPVPVAAKPVGVAFKVTLVPVVEDVNKLPDAFIEKSAKLNAIKATFCVGWKDGQELPVLPGVRFEVKREPVSTARY